MNYKSAPFISIVVAVLNGKATLQRCINSVAQQTYPNKELIIIDGGSRDGTVDVLETNRGKIAFQVSEPDRGIAHAWNKGVERSRGDWVLFLGADDYLQHSDALSSMANCLVGCERSVKVAYGVVIGVNAEGRELGSWSSEWDRERFVYYGIYFSHQGIFHHKDLFACYGEFDEAFRYGPDYEFLLRHLVSHDAAYFPEVIVSVMQSGGVSNRMENSLIALSDLRKARRKHGIKRDALYYYRALVGAYFKRVLWRYLSKWGVRLV